MAPAPRPGTRDEAAFNDALSTRGDDLRCALEAACVRSRALLDRAERSTRNAARARLASRPRSRYVLAEGSLRGERTLAVIRRDGSVAAGTLELMHRLGRSTLPDAPPAPRRQTARNGPPSSSPERDPLQLAPFSPTPRAGRPPADPLAATILVARCFDRLDTLRVLGAADRFGAPVVEAAASIGPLSDDTVFEPPIFTVAVEDVATTRVVHLAGELDIANAATLRSALQGIGGSWVVLDLRALTFIDAAGLSALMIARRDATAEGVRFTITGAAGMVRRVFELTDLAHFLE